MSKNKCLTLSFGGQTYDNINLNNKRDKLGEGGNGTVYQLKQEGKEVNYVVKVLKKFEPKNKQQHRLQRFKNEILSLTKFNEQMLLENSILPIIYSNNKEIDGLNEDLAYYVMPKGENYKSNRNFDLIEVCKILSDILKALKFLHSQNLAHRDIKLDNILLYHSKWYLTDFGLVISENDFVSRLTNEDENVGPYGMPIELRYPNKISDVKIFMKSDIYLYGKLCWQVLTHKRYSFEGELTPGSYPIIELERATKFYPLPILPLIELMNGTIQLNYNKRENLDFIESCLCKQIKLLDEQNNDEILCCSNKQKSFFKIYSKCGTGYFNEDLNDVIDSLLNLEIIKILINKHSELYKECIGKFKTYYSANDSTILLFVNLQRNVEFYLKPRRIELKNYSFYEVLLDKIDENECMKIRLSGEQSIETKVLQPDCSIEIGYFSSSE